MAKGVSLIAIWIVFLPVPSIAAHVIEAELRFPAQFTCCFFGIAIASSNISRATRFNVVWYIHVIDADKRVYYVQDGVALSCADIIDSESGFACDCP